MIKRSFIILLVVLFASTVWAETIYVRVNGTGSDANCSGSSACCAGAFDVSDFNTAGNWDSNVDTSNDKIGPGDTVELCDDDDSGVFRDIFKIQGSGTSGNPITITKHSGDTVVIRTSDRLLAAAWSKVDTDDNIYRATVSTRDYSFGIMFDGESKRSGYYLSSPCGTPPGSCSSWTDEFFWGQTNNDYVYVRSDDGAPGDAELGVRPYGIVSNGEDYITIDGITVYGPLGVDADTWTYTDACDVTNVGCTGGVKKRGPLSFRNSDYIIVQNSSVKYAQSVGIGWWEGGSNGQALDNEIAELWGGIWLNFVGTTWDFSRNHITQISTVGRGLDSGDRDGIGIYFSGGFTIQDNYIEVSGAPGSNYVKEGHGIDISNANAGPNIIRRNYIKNSPHCGILVGENGYGISVYNNIVDGWGVTISNGYVDNLVHGILMGAGADAGTYYDVLVANNLVVNGPSLYATVAAEWNRTVLNAGIFFESNDMGDVTIKNNLITGNQTYYAFAHNFDDVTGSIDVSYNYFDKRSDLGIGQSVGWAAETSWNWDAIDTWETAKAFASNNRNYENDATEPYLTTTAAGTVTISGSTPSTIMSTWGDDLADAGMDIAVASNRTWTPYASMDHLTITRGATYAIGPYEFGNVIPGDILSVFPSAGAVDIDIESVLTWVNPPQATILDLYFDVDNPPTAKPWNDHALATTYDPGTLVSNTTYYWRVDVNDVAGVVYSFTTAPGPIDPPVAPFGVGKGIMKHESAAGRMRRISGGGRLGR